jgi:phage gp36-like protein
MATQYISQAEFFMLGIKEEDLDSDKVNPEDIDIAILSASSEADFYLTAYYDTPLTEIPPALKMHVARAATYHLMSIVGFNPIGSDELLEKNYDNAKKFYKDIQKGQQTIPAGDVSPAKKDGQYVVSSLPKRGW